MILKIALGVFLGIMAVLLVINFSAVTDYVVGAITGWDAQAKAEYQQSLELNRKYLEISRQAAELKAQQQAIQEEMNRRFPPAKHGVHSAVKDAVEFQLSTNPKAESTNDR